MQISPIQYTYDNKHKAQNTNFKRQWTEHMSWGAKYYAKSHMADFKLFTFADAQKVFVEVGKNASDSFGLIKERGVQIVTAIGAALGITGILPKDDKTDIRELENKGDGVFEKKGLTVEEGSEYRFIIVDKNGEVKTVKDPYAKDQSDITAGAGYTIRIIMNGNRLTGLTEKTHEGLSENRSKNSAGWNSWLLKKLIFRP